MQLKIPRSQLTVDELTAHIQGLFTSDVTFKSLIVTGEIAELKRHTSGHCYFTLLGEESRVACAIFKQYAGYVPKWPDSGDTVIVEGSVGVYPQRGVYQLYARRLIPVGEGAIERARLELKERLAKEGLFDQELKRELNPFPVKVALITSDTGAAAWDVIRVAGRRFPSCHIVLLPAQVQGAEAPAAIADALAEASLIHGLDCVLLVRGGGSREDLVPFDDERVVRAVRACTVPVVSGVGHDVDTTLCDLAVDLRASTPSAAAELVFPDQRDVDAWLVDAGNRMAYAIGARLADHKSRIDHAEERLRSRMESHLQGFSSKLDFAMKELRSAVSARLTEAQRALAVRAASLDALSPLSLLTRGFVTCERWGVRISSAKELLVGDEISMRFLDGSVKATVNGVTLEKNKIKTVPHRKKGLS